MENGKTGYLFETGDADALSEAVRKAASLTEKEYASMSENAREFAENNFNEERNYKKIINFYRSILENYGK